MLRTSHLRPKTTIDDEICFVQVKSEKAGSATIRWNGTGILHLNQGKPRIRGSGSIAQNCTVMIIVGSLTGIAAGIGVGNGIDEPGGSVMI